MGGCHSDIACYGCGVEFPEDENLINSTRFRPVDMTETQREKLQTVMKASKEKVVYTM